MRILFGVIGRICSWFFWQKHIQYVHRFVDKHIDDVSKELAERQKLYHTPDPLPKPQQSLVSSLLHAGFDRSKIRFQVIQTIILMRHSTSTLVNNTLYLLSKRPDIWKELHEKITRHRNDKAWSKDGESLIYNCIRESKVVPQHFRFTLRTKRSPTVPCGRPIWAHRSP